MAMSYFQVALPSSSAPFVGINTELSVQPAPTKRKGMTRRRTPDEAIAILKGDRYALKLIPD